MATPVPRYHAWLIVSSDGTVDDGHAATDVRARAQESLDWELATQQVPPPIENERPLLAHGGPEHSTERPESRTENLRPGECVRASTMSDLHTRADVRST